MRIGRLLLGLTTFIGAGCVQAEFRLEPSLGETAGERRIEEARDVSATGVDKVVAPVGLPNFSWVLDGELAGVAHLGQGSVLEARLGKMSETGIERVVSLTETPLGEEQILRSGMEMLHLPVRDFTAPTQEQILAFVDYAHAEMGAGRALAVQCGAGLGRTGTMLAAFLIAEGLSTDDAMAEVRRLRPGSIETASQEEALRNFYAHCRAQGCGAQPLPKDSK